MRLSSPIRECSARVLAVGALAVLAACGSDTISNVSAPANASFAKGGKSKLAPLTFAGYGRSCTILTDGIARCSGYNQEGELGDGTTIQRLTPTPVAGDIPFTSLSLGDFQSCGLTAAGKAYCWGVNSNGSLGDGTTSDQYSPSPVLGNDVFVQIGTGSYHSCALTSDGVTKCWGFFTNGPQAVSGPTFASITHGSAHTCGLTSAGDAYCWGNYNNFNYGQLGYGTNDYSETPLPVVGGIRFSSIDAGYNHTCGLDSHGRAYCWGSNYIGQLGDGTQTDRLEPTPVATKLRFSEIRGGNSHTCAITRQGEAYCWGNGFSGQLGDGTFRKDSLPVRVAGGIKFESLSPGGGSSECGVTRGNDIYCWGWNFFGAIGDGTTDDRAVPTLVTP